MLAVNRDQHWPLTAWLVMIILRVPSPSAWLAPGEGRRQGGGAIVLLFGQVFTLNRYPGRNSRKAPSHRRGGSQGAGWGTGRQTRSH